MFEKFTERAREVMNIARAEAQRLNSEFVGTEHILLGIVQEGGGLAVKVLKNLDVDLRRVRQGIEHLLKPNPTPTGTHGDLPLSPRATRVLELAQESAIQLGHDVIGSQHLLLGLLKVHEGIAAMVLQNLGVHLNGVHDMVLELLRADIPPTPKPPKAEDLLAKAQEAFLRAILPPESPMSDQFGELRMKVEALDSTARDIIGDLQQLKSKPTNDAAWKELAELRTRILAMIEEWKGKLGGK